MTTTYLGYDQALIIVLACSGRTGPADPVFDPIAPPASKDEIIQCILLNVQNQGYSLPGPLIIGDTETCDSAADKVQRASK